jgi:ATPase subunit of ABC transporter with duplicated ATPase domains
VAHLIGAEALGVDFGTGPILKDLSLGLDDGDRIGIVGANGAGKSTLIAALSGALEPHSGRVTAARSVRIGSLAQADALVPGQTVVDAIVGDADVHEWASDPRVRDVMNGLVPELPAEALVDNLSGGQRRRVALAHLLVGDHDVIFLDEPTNHLDVDGVAWLADHLKRRWAARKGALAVVTHDRWFLDEVTTRTWEVNDASVEQYDGGYAAYILQRVERDRISSVTEQRRQNLLRKELAWLRRGAPARTTKPKFRIDAANALIADVPIIRDRVQLARTATARLGKDVVELVRCSVRFGDNEVLTSIDWNLGPGERTGLLGENGAGKSTLLKLITGELEPTSGHVRRGVTVRVAALSQQLAELEEVADDRVSAVVKRYSSVRLADGVELTPTQLLERLGFAPAQLKTLVKSLSGGQRRRLQLLMVLLSEPNVLVLDEPTNDLDTDMLAALEDLLDSWPGTLIVVSHDRYLLERVTDDQYAVLDGGLRHLPGGIDEYISLQRTRRSGGVGTFGASDTADAGAGASSQAGSGPTGAERRALEKEVTSIERRLTKIIALVAALDTRMVSDEASDYEAVARMGAERSALIAEQNSIESRWLELHELLG